MRLTKIMKAKINYLCEVLGRKIDYDDWDSSLTEEENLKELGLPQDLVGITLADLIAKFQLQEQQALQEKRDREEAHYKKEFEKEISKIKSLNVVSIEKYFYDVKNYTKILIKATDINSLIIVGRRGIGKSFNSMATLEELNKKFLLLKGHITPLSLYKTLYENSEGVIVLDDLASVILNRDIIAILLSATDYNTKMVKWISSSPLLTLPNEFMFKGKLVLIINKLVEDNEFIEAVKDRCFFLQFDLTDRQIIKIMYEIAKSKKIPLDIVDYIKELSESRIIKNISLRLIDKAYENFKNDKPNWKEDFKKIIEFDDLAELVMRVSKECATVKGAMEKFVEETGMSRPTFFRIKARIEKCEK